MAKSTRQSRDRRELVSAEVVERHERVERRSEPESCAQRTFAIATSLDNPDLVLLDDDGDLNTRRLEHAVQAGEGLGVAGATVGSQARTADVG
jgi:hypothetical protein